MIGVLGNRNTGGRNWVVLLSGWLILCWGGMIHGASPKSTIHTVLQKLASEYSKKGFKLRKENWSGRLKVGEQRTVKHQLFRGNEYWFWAAVPENDCSLKVDIFDDDGHAVSLENFSDKGVSGARVLPVKTGMYLVRITVTRQDDAGKVGGEIDWALAYGYR